MWGSEHSKVVKELFDNLNKNNIKWMVLRNYEGLPEKNRSKDIDLVMKKKDFKEVESILIEILKQNGFEWYIKDVYQYVWCFTFFKIMDDKIISIKIDLLDGFVWKGAQLIHFKDIYKNKVSYKNFYVPNKIDDAFMLWIKPLLTGGFVKDKYREDILEAINKNPDEFRKRVISVFGNKIGEKVWKLLEKKDLDKTVLLKKELAYNAWYLEFKRHPVKTIYSTFEHYYKEILRRSIRKKGTFLSVAGPDGVGKTTFIELLRDQLAKIFVKEKKDICVEHFRPKIIPSLKQLFSGKNYDESKEEFTKPHRAKPANLLSSFIRINYYWIDYILGYFLRIKFLCSNGKICIFDRYFYDFIIDPYRSRIKLPEIIRKFYWRITPKPDLIFLLVCDKDTIYKRKQELTKDEIERQLDKYKSLAKTSQRFRILNACDLPQEVCFEALKEIVKISAKKIK